MHDFLQQCPNCGTVFRVQEMGIAVPGGKEPEEIFCPMENCRHMCGRQMTCGWFQTTKATPEEAKAYLEPKA